MSAIWGCIDFSGEAIEKDLPEKMSRCTKKYRIDKTDQLLEGCIYMACGLQYITKESYSEELPYCDKGIYYTADCILDGRDDLLKELGQTANSQMPDGKLLFLAYQKWGEDFGEHVLGLFSFAVYDSIQREFHLYTDHTASRCIHYHIRGSRVYFSTLTTSITGALPDIEICEKWMWACEQSIFSFAFIHESLTPFEGVYIVPYGSGITVKDMGQGLLATTRRYWDPLGNISQDNKRADSQYRQEFLTTHISAVRDAIRTDGEVGVLLSGGLDSTSVASVAATELARTGKDLFSYTSIPLEEFRQSKENKSVYWIDDESHLVLELCKMYPNIRPEFMDCEGISTWTYLEDLVDFMEMPGKAFVNDVWINSAYKEAREKGCKVVMGGFWGNYTISYGSMEETAYKDIVSGHPISGINELMGYAKKMHFSRKKYMKHFLHMCSDSRKKTDFSVCLKDDCLKEINLREYDSTKTWEKLLSEGGGAFKSSAEKKHFVINPYYMQHMGVECTKYGLYHGIVIRDPSADKRMLELCLRLPYKCFASDGVERRLVREYLKDYLPDKIRCEVIRRGRQSQDAALRMEKYSFPDGKEPWDKITDKIEKYYYKDKIVEKLKENRGRNIDWQIKVVSCNLFLEKNQK